MTDFSQCPDSVLDYSIDWTAWLEDADRITGSIWTAPGLTVTMLSHTDAMAVAWLSGGDQDVKYKVTNTIMTVQGRTHCQSFLLQII